MYKDVKDGKDVIVCMVGKTTLLYDASCISDLHTMLKNHGDWMDLGGADEQKDAKEGTVEAWEDQQPTRLAAGTGLKRGFADALGFMYPPLMEALGLAELTHDAKNNKNAAK